MQANVDKIRQLMGEPVDRFDDVTQTEFADSERPTTAKGEVIRETGKAASRFLAAFTPLQRVTIFIFLVTALLVGFITWTLREQVPIIIRAPEPVKENH
ncbi:MAG TPA: hypothetical protein VLC09_09210 [Polyangiaceae bacterium]|nr:hypothetical protein [Polyangiaceae bacterium]